jgi:hypothetical protein
MSLLRPVIRACAVAALRDKSWAESRVYDSDMTPLTEAVSGTATTPYIVVYTDTDDIPAIRGAGEIYDGDSRQLQIVLEIGVASAIKNKSGGASASGPTLVGGRDAVDPDPGASARGWISFKNNPSNGDTIAINGTVITFVTASPLHNQVHIGATLSDTLAALLTLLQNSSDIGLVACTYGLAASNALAVVATIPGAAGNNITLAANVTGLTTQFTHTDFGTELAVDVISAQALAALWGDPRSPWANLFKRFLLRLKRLPTRRGGQAGGGVRFAARRITLVCSTIYDFAPGIVPPPNHAVA